MTACRHCGKRIVQCGVEGERCWAEGWKHGEFTASRPVAAHFCGGDASGPLAEPEEAADATAGRVPRNVGAPQ